jgi:hypothetical protein
MPTPGAGQSTSRPENGMHVARDCAWQAVGLGLVVVGLLIAFGSLPAPPYW